MNFPNLFILQSLNQTRLYTNPRRKKKTPSNKYNNNKNKNSLTIKDRRHNYDL